MYTCTSSPVYKWQVYMNLKIRFQDRQTVVYMGSFDYWIIGTKRRTCSWIDGSVLHLQNAVGGQSVFGRSFGGVYMNLMGHDHTNEHVV